MAAAAIRPSPSADVLTAAAKHCGYGEVEEAPPTPLLLADYNSRQALRRHTPDFRSAGRRGAEERGAPAGAVAMHR